MNTLILITGGARSGKSRYALSLGSTYSRKAYIATARALDPEMEERIRQHRRERDPSYTTIEASIDLPQVLRSAMPAFDFILVDCLTLWLANLFLERKGVSQDDKMIVDLLEVLRSRLGPSAHALGPQDGSETGSFAASSPGLARGPQPQYSPFTKPSAGFQPANVSMAGEWPSALPAGLPAGQAGRPAARSLDFNSAALVLVTNEVGMGIVPDSPMGRSFRDLQGFVNQQVSRLAEEVFFMVSGVPLPLKKKELAHGNV